MKIWRQWERAGEEQEGCCGADALRAWQRRVPQCAQRGAPYRCCCSKTGRWGKGGKRAAMLGQGLTRAALGAAFSSPHRVCLRCCTAWCSAASPQPLALAAAGSAPA